MRVDVVAIDINVEINATQTKIIGEAARIWAELPKNISFSTSLKNGVLL